MVDVVVVLVVAVVLISVLVLVVGVGYGCGFVCVCGCRGHSSSRPYKQHIFVPLWCSRSAHGYGFRDNNKKHFPPLP